MYYHIKQYSSLSPTPKDLYLDQKSAVKLFMEFRENKTKPLLCNLKFAKKNFAVIQQCMWSPRILSRVLGIASLNFINFYQLLLGLYNTQVMEIWWNPWLSALKCTRKNQTAVIVVFTKSPQLKKYKRIKKWLQKNFLKKNTAF